MIVQLIGALLLFFPFSNNLGFFDSIFYVVFHSISTFTNVDYSILSSSGLILTNVLIFIGASSGSTSGGIKVSTLAVIFIYIINLFKGKKPTIFKRQITDDTIKRAFTIFFLAIAFILLGVFSLSLTETLPE